MLCCFGEFYRKCGRITDIFIQLFYIQQVLIDQVCQALKGPNEL